MTDKLYHAASLEDVAKLFDRNAEAANTNAAKATTRLYINECLLRANTWKLAAEILRQTEISNVLYIDEASNVTPKMFESHPAQADVDKIMKEG